LTFQGFGRVRIDEITVRRGYDVGNGVVRGGRSEAGRSVRSGIG
jgi:hypothetical protein